MSDRNPTVLIIDNDEGLLSALETRLADDGMNVVSARSGAQGLAAFAAHDIDLVITDLNMPNGDGISLIEHIRSAGTTPVIVMTGFRDEFRPALRSLSNVTVLRKPFPTEQLRELIETELMLDFEFENAHEE